MSCMHDNTMAEGTQCHCTFMYSISAIVGHFSPDFASLNYSMRRSRISNKNILATCSESRVMGPSGWCTVSVLRPSRRLLCAAGHTASNRGKQKTKTRKKKGKSKKKRWRTMTLSMHLSWPWQCHCQCHCRQSILVSSYYWFCAIG